MSLVKQLSFFLLIAFSACASNKKTDGKSAEVNSSETQVSIKAEEMEPEVQNPPVPLENKVWKTYSEADLPDLERRIQPEKFDVWMCDYKMLMQDLIHEEVLLPCQGQIQLFQLENSGTMSPALAEKYPEIKSFKGSSKDQSIVIRVDTNEEGLFAEFKVGGNIFLLEPLLKGSKTYYAFYDKSDLPKQQRDEDYEK